MTNEHAQHEDLIQALDALGRRINAATYAGPDWHPRARTRSIRLALGAAGALAVAAAIVAALLATWPKPRASRQPISEVPLAEMPVDLVPPSDLGVPFGGFEEVVGDVTLEIPSDLSIPSGASLGDVSLSIPTFSWTSLERSDSDDT